MYRLQISQIYSLFIFLAVTSHVFFLYKIHLDFPLSITIDRIFLLFALTLLFLIILIDVHNMPAFPLLFGILMSISLTISLAYGMGAADFPSRGFLTYVCIAYFIGTSYAICVSKISLDWLLRSFWLIGFVLIIFASWFYGSYVFYGSWPTQPPFGDLERLFSVAEPSLSDGSSAFRRSMLPFTRSHDFGLTSALCFFIVLWSVIRKPKIINPIVLIFFLSMLVLMVVLSGARSSIIPFFSILFVLIVLRLVGESKIKRNISFVLSKSFAMKCIGLFVVFAIMTVIITNLEVAFIFERVAGDMRNHIDLRYEAVEAYLSYDPWRMLIGVGPEGYRPFLSGTESRGSAHATYLTVLTEMGLLGLMAFFSILLLTIKRLYNVKSKIRTKEKRILWSIVIMLLVSNYLYDFQASVTQWIVLGVVLGYTYTDFSDSPSSDKPTQ